MFLPSVLLILDITLWVATDSNIFHPLLILLALHPRENATPYSLTVTLVLKGLLTSHNFVASAIFSFIIVAGSKRIKTWLYLEKTALAAVTLFFLLAAQIIFEYFTSPLTTGHGPILNIFAVNTGIFLFCEIVKKV